jgi:dihydroflavonol-4-reductase
MSKTVFITGATGLLGSYLALELLQQNHHVKALYRHEKSKEQVKAIFSYYTSNAAAFFDKIEWIKGDLNETFVLEDALKDATDVYHCAGLVSFNKKDREQLYAINAKGTANIVNACLENGKVNLCYVSSIAAINNADYKAALNETIFWKTKGNESDYAKSKYSGEREVWRGIEEGLNAVIVNPGVILASGFWHQSSGKIFSLCYKGQSFYTMGKAAYIDVIDAARIMLQLMQQQKFSERYILIEGNYEYKFVLDTIHSLFNKKQPSIKAERGMLQLAQWGSKLKHLFSPNSEVVTKEIAQALLSTQLYDNTKVKTQLNYTFTPFGSTLQRICKNYLQDVSKKST